MKTKLIVLSVLVVGFTTQCSLYERMKAKAASAAQSVKNTATSAYDKVGGMARSASGKIQSAASSVKGRITGAAEDFVDFYIDPIRGKVSRFFNKISPTMTKVTITDAETGETVEKYYNPMTDDVPRF